jgi:hypothetical protein
MYTKKHVVFLEMIVVFMLKCKVVDFNDQCAKSHFEYIMFAPSLPHFEIFGRINMPNKIHVVHLIVDPNFYYTKFNMNIVHNTL